MNQTKKGYSEVEDDNEKSTIGERRRTLNSRTEIGFPHFHGSRLVHQPSVPLCDLRDLCAMLSLFRVTGPA
jgi:hypothetical protein